MLLRRIPGARRTRSGVWWLTIAGCVLLAATLVGVIIAWGAVADR